MPCSRVRGPAAGLEPTFRPPRARPPARSGIRWPLRSLLSLKLPSRDIRCPAGAPPHPRHPHVSAPAVAGRGLLQHCDRACRPRPPPSAETDPRRRPRGQMTAQFLFPEDSLGHAPDDGWGRKAGGARGERARMPGALQSRSGDAHLPQGDQVDRGAETRRGSPEPPNPPWALRGPPVCTPHAQAAFPKRVPSPPAQTSPRYMCGGSFQGQLTTQVRLEPGGGGAGSQPGARIWALVSGCLCSSSLGRPPLLQVTSRSPVPPGSALQGDIALARGDSQRLDQDQGGGVVLWGELTCVGTSLCPLPPSTSSSSGTAPHPKEGESILQTKYNLSKCVASGSRGKCQGDPCVGLSHLPQGRDAPPTPPPRPSAQRPGPWHTGTSRGKGLAGPGPLLSSCGGQDEGLHWPRGTGRPGSPGAQSKAPRSRGGGSVRDAGRAAARASGCATELEVCTGRAVTD